MVVISACHPAVVPVAVPPVSKGTVRIRSFTEPAPAMHLAVAGSFVFVVTGRGLERWGKDGEVIELSATHGLPSDDILSLGVDTERRALWILTPGTIGSYDTDREIYSEIAQPSASTGLDLGELHAGDRTALAAASDGGVWVGSPQGLHHGSGDGWIATTIKDPVLSLATTSEGVAVVTRTAVLLQQSDGDVVKIGSDHGLLVTRPERALAVPKLGGIVILGSDDRGAPLLAIGRGLQWHSFRMLPGLSIDDATVDDGDILLLGGGQMYRLTLRDKSELRPLARDGVRLSAMNSAGPDLALTSMPIVVPPGALSVAVSGEHVLIGTRDIGVARYRDQDVRPSSWLRRRQMFRDATTLSVACASVDDCWLATGSRSAWHWTGDRFAAGGPDEVVLAVVRDRNGTIFALHREARATSIQLSRVDSAGQWARIPKVSLATPGQEPEVSFARFAASGALWVGLRYHDGADVRAWGVAVIEIRTGKVAHHRPSADLEERKTMMPIPIGVVDADVRGDAAWFATKEGVARLSMGAIDVWNEGNGLRSELARAIAVTRAGAVFVATSAGVGRFDGTAWHFPGQLGFDVNDLAVTANGQLWMATGRGIAAFDGTKVRRVDLRRGLVENEILDIAIDRFDRIWGRGPGSLTLISP
jgi:hypothetical protein